MITCHWMSTSQQHLNGGVYIHLMVICFLLSTMVVLLVNTMVTSNGSAECINLSNVIDLTSGTASRMMDDRFSEHSNAESHLTAEQEPCHTGGYLAMSKFVNPEVYPSGDSRSMENSVEDDELYIPSLSSYSSNQTLNCMPEKTVIQCHGGDEIPHTQNSQTFVSNS